LKGNTKAIRKATVENASLRGRMTEEMSRQFHIRYPQKKDGDVSISILQKKLLYKA